MSPRGAALLVVLVPLSVALLVMSVRALRARAAERRKVVVSDEVVRYAVPPGREPDDVRATLRSAGFEAMPEPDDERVLVVRLPLGEAQRSEVSRLLGDSSSLDG